MFNVRHKTPSGVLKPAEPTFKQRKVVYKSRPGATELCTTCQKYYTKGNSYEQHLRTHADQEFVYFRYHIVSKTDIVFSVNVHDPDAKI